MEPEPLEGYLDNLAPTFVLAQSEIHAETLRVLQHKFQKEKKYWENLVASKDEVLTRLERELEAQTSKSNRLREKIHELQSEQTGMIQQSFSTLDLQKRSHESHLKRLEDNLESAHKDMLTLKMDLEEEHQNRVKLKLEWADKEKFWQEEADQRAMDVENTKKKLLSNREKELEDISKMEETIKKLNRELADFKTITETEKAGQQNLLNEKDSNIDKAREDVADLMKKLDIEKEQRRLAAVEREKLNVQGEEDRSRLTEQILLRETKIKELEQNLEGIIKDRTEKEESLREREKAILAHEEAIRQRREEWVDSVRSQANQELSISEKSVDLLSKLETKLGLKPPAVPYSQALKLAGPPPIQKDTDQNLQALAEKYPSLKSSVAFIRKRESWILIFSGLILFSLTLSLFIFESQGRKSVRAQTLLQSGNDLFTKGNLEESLKSLSLGYKLDPKNTIIRNSLTLVLAELAHKEKREGNLELALKRVERLYTILPEDPDVIRLHGEILQALGSRMPSDKTEGKH